MVAEKPNTPHQTLRDALAAFLTANPESRLEARDGVNVIADPWGDTTLELCVRDERAGLTDLLNHLRLPPSLSAIYHRDTGQLEMIWTALPVPERYRMRAFTFQYGDRSFKCEFGPSSDRLLTLADVSRPVRPPSETEHRNLMSFSLLLHHRRDHPDSSQARREPMSFWVGEMEWDDERTIEMLRHLNFFMRYFDPRTPFILIHEEREEEGGPRQYRLPDQEFPGTICGRALDDYILGLWESARGSGDPVRGFLYNYQILEYAAFYYVQEEIQSTIRRQLADPRAVAQPDLFVQGILNALAQEKRSEEDRVVAIVERLVDPIVVWRQIDANRSFFVGTTDFSGGFAAPGLVRADWKLEDFRASWIPLVPHTLRRLRNALVHAREARMAEVVAPSRANYVRLKPWRQLIEAIAAEVVLYWDA